VVYLMNSHTLIAWSRDPVTILLPSGENATDTIASWWANVFSLSSPSLPARKARRYQYWSRMGDFELAAHQNPRL